MDRHEEPGAPATARQRLLDVEAQIIQALACTRSMLEVVEQENRDLRIQVERTRVEFYTEREFAKFLKVSESTVARLRKAGRIEHLLVGNQIRYSSTHLAKIDEVLSARKNDGARAGTQHRPDRNGRIQ